LGVEGSLDLQTTRGRLRKSKPGTGWFLDHGVEDDDGVVALAEESAVKGAQAKLPADGERERRDGQADVPKSRAARIGQRDPPWTRRSRAKAAPQRGVRASTGPRGGVWSPWRMIADVKARWGRWLGWIREGNLQQRECHRPEATEPSVPRYSSGQPCGADAEPNRI